MMKVKTMNQNNDITKPEVQKELVEDHDVNAEKNKNTT